MWRRRPGNRDKGRERRKREGTQGKFGRLKTQCFPLCTGPEKPQFSVVRNSSISAGKLMSLHGWFSCPGSQVKANLLLCKCSSMAAEHLHLSSKVLILLGSVHLVLFVECAVCVCVCIPEQKNKFLCKCFESSFRPQKGSLCCFILNS